MNKTSLILSAVMMIALAILFAPGIFALNRGKTLQNIALWLAIFTGLALVYKTFGPGSEHPLFSFAGMARHESEEYSGKPIDDTKQNNPKTNTGNGFTPPAE